MYLKNGWLARLICGTIAVFIAIILILFVAQNVYAHPGNTASDGCHYCRTNCGRWGVAYGRRHCHQNKGVPQPYEPIRSHQDGTFEVWEPYKMQEYGTRAVGSTSGRIFTRVLSFGSVGEDVRRLQIRLNAEGFVVSTSGAGSPGNETSYFGTKTKQALIRYQNAHRADILTPIGLYFGTGYFGPMTMRHMNG